MQSFFVERNITVYDMINDKFKEFLWGLRFINIEDVWEAMQIEDIKHIKVAVIDSGIEEDHEDLCNCVLEGYNFIADNKDAHDDYGHGTRVSGIIGAEKNNGIGICGAAAGVKLIPLKVCNKNGKAKSSNVVKAIEWCIENKVDVINMSLGYEEENALYYYSLPSTFNMERHIIDLALKENIIIVSSVGNGFGRAMHFPAVYAGVVPVASYGLTLNPMKLYISERNSSFDSRTVFAPGEYIYTTNINNEYIYDSGSSMASAFVTAAAALMKAKVQEINSHQFHEIILKTSRKLKINNNLISAMDVGEAFQYLLHTNIRRGI